MPFNRFLAGSGGRRSFIVYSISLFLALAVAWSLWAELDQVSRAPGQVIPAGRLQVLQSTDGGTISQILVREGDTVKRGQLLVKLDDVRIKAVVEEAQAKAASLRISMARINAELFGRPLAFPPESKDYPEFVENQTLLYQKRRQALEDQLSAIRAMLRLNQQELDMNLPLLAQGDVSRADVLRLQRSVSDLQAQMVNIRNKYLADLQAEYTKTQEDLVTATEMLNQRSDALKDTQIVAPTDGIVKNVRLTTIGGVLRPGDEVLTIVPTGERLIIEARVAPADIANIKLGQAASLKFDAYDSSIYGSASGTVSFISPDTTLEQTPNGNISFYRVQIAADTSRMKPHKQGEEVQMQPGMTVTAEILTGRNTVFRYLFKPLSKTFSEAMTER